MNRINADANDALTELITLPKITRNYISKLRFTIQTVDNRKDINKYARWILCMTYLIPIITLYIKTDIRLNNFLTNSNTIKNDSTLNVMQGEFTFYDVQIPDELIDLSDLIDHDAKSSISIATIEFVHKIMSNHECKEYKVIKKMLEHMYFIIGTFITDTAQEVTVFCWQFKSKEAIDKLNNIFTKSSTRLISKLSDDHVCIYYNEREIIQNTINNLHKEISISGGDDLLMNSNTLSNTSTVMHDDSKAATSNLDDLNNIQDVKMSLPSIMNIFYVFFWFYVYSVCSIIKFLLKIDAIRMTDNNMGHDVWNRLPEFIKSKFDSIMHDNKNQ